MGKVYKNPEFGDRSNISLVQEQEFSVKNFGRCGQFFGEKSNIILENGMAPTTFK